MPTLRETLEKTRAKRVASSSFDLPGAEIKQAPIRPLIKSDIFNFQFGDIDKITSKIPESIRRLGRNIKEGLFGRGQGVDITGATKFDTGLIGIIRPFGIGKPKAQKVSDRIDLLKPLINEGQITQERADEIVQDTLRPTGQDPLQLSSSEKKALRPVVIEEAIDKIFGALDFVSLGTLKPIARSVASRIAKSKSANEIIDFLTKEIPDLPTNVKQTFGSILREIDNVDDVQRVINKTRLAVQEAGKAQAGNIPEAIAKVRARRGVTVIEKPTVAPTRAVDEITPTGESTIQKLARDDFARAESEVLTLLETSVAGARISTESGVKAIKSTFPDFISPELRSQKLFESVVKKRNEGIEIKGVREKQLNKEIDDAIFGRMEPRLAEQRALESIDPTDVPASKKLQPLAKEAQKFKTVDEFSNKAKQSVNEILPDNLVLRDIDIVGSVAVGGKAPNDIDIVLGIFDKNTGKKINDFLDLDVTKKMNAPELLKLNNKIKEALSKHFSGGKIPVDALLFGVQKERPSLSLTDFFNKVKEVEAPIEEVKELRPALKKVLTDRGKQLVDEAGEIVEIKSKSPITKEAAKEGFPAPTKEFENYEVQQISGASAFDIETAHKIRSNPKITPGYVAMRTMRDGRKIPAIRKSGIYAPKEFETFNFRDISGLLGGKTFNFRDAALSLDNVTARQASEEGAWGPMTYQSYETRTAMGEADTFAVDNATLVRMSAEKNGVKITKETGEELFRGLNGEKVSGNMRPVVIEVRKILDTIRKEANIVRKNMGKKEIGFIDNYAPFMQEVRFWRDALEKGKTEITDNFDFIIPNAKKNPHAITRNPGAVHENLEMNAWKLIETYTHNMSQDIFVAPQIERLKAINSVLTGRNLNGASNFLNRFIRENLVGKAGSLDFYLGITEGTIKRKAVGTFVMARNVASLAGNLIWILFVQPASLLGMTLPRAGGVTRGLQNTLGGVYDFATNKELRDKIKTLPTAVSKSKGASVGMTGAGDLDKQAGKIIKTKIETYNDFIGKVADAQEYWLTGGSIGAGYREGKKIGLVGKDLDIFADWMGGATQSEYNRLARPLILNNLMVRALFPFQTFATEMYRFVKTLVGLPGGMPLEKSQRVNQAIMLIVGAYTYNQWSEKTTGRTLTTVGTAIPLVGGAVDFTVNKGREALGFNTGTIGSGRSPIAPQEDVLSFIESISAYVDDGNIQPLRKELVRWGMGFSGISGAATVNRFVDGMIANVQGFQKTKSGKFAFIVEGDDKLLAPLMGPWSTSAGKDYLNKQTEGNRKKANIRPLYDNAQELKNEGKEAQAQALVDSLTSEEYKIYKTIASGEKARRTQELKGDMLPVFRKAQELLDDGKGGEAQALVDSLSSEEFSAYKAIKKEVERHDKAKDGKKPEFGANETLSDRSIVETVAVYAKALALDPVTAFDRVFTGQIIRRVDSGAIIVERLSFKESTRIKTIFAEGEDLSKLKLDHTISLQLGGSNAEDNLKLVTTAEWKSYTPIENHLGKLLRDKKIGKKEAQQLITDFKEGRITANEILNK